MALVQSLKATKNLQILNRIFLSSSSVFRKVSSHSKELVIEKRNNGVITLGLNRPETKNALSRKVLAEFEEALMSVQHDKDARALVIYSLVKNIFCAGADLKERASMPEAEVGPFVARIRKVLANLRDLPVPTIAAIDGPALGGGLEMSLGCDIRIASATSKLGLVETKLAIIPGGGGTQLLPRLVGPAIAKELIFTGRILDGEQAFKIGLVNDVVEQNSDGNAAFLRASQLAEEIGCQGPIAVRLAKIAINKGLDVDLNTGLAFEQACYAQTIGTKDRVEGLKAFKEKRLPVYKAE